MRALRYNEYIDFSDFLVEPNWKRLHLDICLGISNCSVRYGTGGYQHPKSYSTRGLTGGTYLKNIIHELPEEVKPRFEKMDILQKTMFATWYLGYNAMPLIYIRGTNTYEAKHTPAGSFETENTKYFTALYEWLEKSKLFSQTGRITLFLSPQGYESRKHKDLPPDTKYTAIDEFVWLNPRGLKKFYLENDQGEKVDVQTQAAWFNSYQYHGAYASQEQNYGLRIDGTFTKEARQFIEHQQNQHDHVL